MDALALKAERRFAGLSDSAEANRVWSRLVATGNPELLRAGEIRRIRPNRPESAVSGQEAKCFNHFFLKRGCDSAWFESPVFSVQYLSYRLCQILSICGLLKCFPYARRFGLSFIDTVSVAGKEYNRDLGTN